jgi:hypothetical protein
MMRWLKNLKRNKALEQENELLKKENALLRKRIKQLVSYKDVEKNTRDYCKNRGVNLGTK